MKTLIIISSFLFFSFSAKAQIELEKTYNFSGTLTEIDNDEFKYIIMDVPLNECRLYNEDHTLYKTFGLTLPSGYFLYDVKFVSRKAFNTNENIELLYIYNKVEIINGESVYSYGLRVIDDAGNLLLNLSDGGFAEIMKGKDGLKLLAYQYIWNESYYLVYTNIYSLGGTAYTPTSLITKGMKVFPNPVSEKMNIQIDPSFMSGNGKIMVYDLMGRELIFEDLSKGINTISIGTEKLSSGTYIVSSINENGERRSELFEKK